MHECIIEISYDHCIAHIYCVNCAHRFNSLGKEKEIHLFIGFCKSSALSDLQLSR